MVILEANKYGVPVLCSNIGGMAEKVQHGVTGLHFQVGRADSLAEQMEWIVNNRQSWEKFPENCSRAFDSMSDFEEHLEVYSSLEKRENEHDLFDDSACTTSSLRAA